MTRPIDRRGRLVLKTPLLNGRRQRTILVERWGLALCREGVSSESFHNVGARVESSGDRCWRKEASRESQSAASAKILAFGRFGEIRGEYLTKREQCSIAILASTSMLLPYPQGERE